MDSAYPRGSPASGVSSMSGLSRQTSAPRLFGGAPAHMATPLPQRGYAQAEITTPQPCSGLPPTGEAVAAPQWRQSPQWSEMAVHAANPSGHHQPLTATAAAAS